MMAQTKFLNLRNLACTVVVGVVGFMLPVAAHADPVTYSYTGSNYTGAEFDDWGPYTTSDHVTGSFTVPSALADNLNDALVSPTSFSFYDGAFQTIATPDAFVEAFNLSTDASGTITFWDIQIDDNATGNDIYIESGGDSVDSIALVFSDSSGSWTSAAVPSEVPEPESIVLIGTGLLGFAGAFRRRWSLRA